MHPNISRRPEWTVSGREASGSLTEAAESWILFFYILMDLKTLQDGVKTKYICSPLTLTSTYSTPSLCIIGR